MSAVKRVQKFLQQAEKRATASVNLSSSKKRDRERLAQIARGSEALKKEEVFVKATGRAIEKALRVGKWFEERESEYTVRVETGSVLVVDDVVEDEGRKRSLEEKVKGGGGGTSQGSESRAKKQRRAASALAAAEEELPETRTRWVNKVDVSIAFK